MPTWYAITCALLAVAAIIWATRAAGLWHDTTSRIWREHRASGRTPNRR